MLVRAESVDILDTLEDKGVKSLVLGIEAENNALEFYMIDETGIHTYKYYSRDSNLNRVRKQIKKACPYFLPYLKGTKMLNAHSNGIVVVPYRPQR